MQRALLLVAIAALVLSACAHSRRADSRPARKPDYFAVKTTAAEFYLYGPQQITGPDRKLARDTLVTVSSKSFGYARVRLTNGEEGYVALDDLRPAPDSLVAQTFASPTPAPTPANFSYPEPKLPAAESTPEVEPTAIAAPSP